MTTLTEHIIVGGAENYPLMLENSMYDTWASLIHLFIKGKKNGRMMLDLIDNGSLVYPTVEDNRQTRPKKYSELTKAQQLQDNCDVQATNIILYNLPLDADNNLKLNFLNWTLVLLFLHVRKERIQLNVSTRKWHSYLLWHQDCDDISLAKAVLMENLSSYDTDVLSVGKDVVYTAISKPSAIITPGMFKLDIEPISYRLKNNSDAYEVYLEKTIENTNTFRGLVECARKWNPSKPLLESACIFTKHVQELLVYVSKTCPSLTKPTEKLVVVTPMSKDKKLGLFNANHDMCVIDYVNDANIRSKSKSKRNKMREVWKPMGKVFNEIGYSWKPTGRAFTIVKNKCPLTRFTSTKVVPTKETTNKSTLTPTQGIMVYSRIPKALKLVGSRSKSKITESRISNSLNPTQSRGSIVSDVPSSSLNDYRTSSNLRNQATIQDKRVTVQQVKGGKDKVMLAIAIRMSLDAYDSDCDDVSNAKAVLMANHSNYGTDVISEAAVPDTNVYAQQDSIILSVIEQRSMENANLKHQYQGMVFVIASLKNDLRKKKGKETVENAAQIPIATTIAPGMFKIDLEPLARSEDLGKLNAKVDIGIFVGYAPIKKDFRIYNRRTQKIMETIHVTFDELTIMASEKFDSGDGLQLMTPAISSLRLVPNVVPQQPCNPPNRDDWDRVFHPMFDEYFNPLTISVSQVLLAAEPRTVDIADSHVST
uniref:Retroviral polymerase SH3-like domain-containing protein n=1 Tax=Tanacetum cinerariifolium TaxID=118510 RepID=A0A6L2NL35_TANCI|nr:hypothetical protein [Tanacetum cinerariifolium]